MQHASCKEDLGLSVSFDIYMRQASATSFCSPHHVQQTLSCLSEVVLYPLLESSLLYQAFSVRMMASMSVPGRSCTVAIYTRLCHSSRSARKQHHITREQVVSSL